MKIADPEQDIEKVYAFVEGQGWELDDHQRALIKAWYENRGAGSMLIGRRHGHVRRHG